MTVETDIDALAARVNIRKDKAVRIKGDLDALVTEGTSVAALTTTATASALVVRTEATSMSTAATALATSAVGASSFADLSALAASKSEVAKDVFIYDTSLDSDGGAWRSRIQGTSWYQETLNTATRGSRREFPAVAVIVAETTKVTIYDGDTVGLPMWMVLSTSGSTGALYADVKCVFALNGLLCVGVDPHLARFNFVSDNIFSYRNSIGQPSFQGDFPTGIAGRNSTSVYRLNSTASQLLINDLIHDVAMNVLPNAPTDSATGLPIPTIAVATNSGLSIIRHNGTIVTVAAVSTAWVKKIEFVGSSVMMQGAYADYSPWIISIPDSNVTGWGYNNQPIGITNEEYSTTGSNQKGGANLFYLGVTGVDGQPIGADRNNRFFATPSGISIVAANTATPSEGLVSYATAQYTTGWMHGAIKGAWLADTLDADLFASGEMVTNGTFATDTTGWTSSAGLSVTVSNGQVTLTNGTGFSVYAENMYQDISGLVVGRTYVLSYNYIGGTNRVRLVIGLPFTQVYSNTATTVTFVATSTSTRLTFYLDALSLGNNAILDNISVRHVDADRSVNSISLNINGRITRTPVADNADLVGYSGFSATNYLEQPYNSGLDFGTGDFSIMGWVNSSANYQTVVSRFDSNGTAGNGWFLQRDGGGALRFFNTIAGSATSISKGSLTSNVWQLVTVTRRSGVLLFYIDGVLVGSQAFTGSVTHNNSVLYVGVLGPTRSDTANRLALLRISGTAPSADQIAKIFKDERKLFEPGARCTLYGASDAVTALSYDKVTNLLHVGTSAGRSVFDGPARVSNTTSPVRAVIAAHGGLVIED